VAWWPSLFPYPRFSYVGDMIVAVTFLGRARAYARYLRWRWRITRDLLRHYHLPSCAATFYLCSHMGFGTQHRRLLEHGDSDKGRFTSLFVRRSRALLRAATA